MSEDKYRNRTYRNLFNGKNLTYFRSSIGETDLQIGADRRLEFETLELVQKYRNQVKDYIHQNPLFLTSLKPLNCDFTSPEIIKRMCESSTMVNVGPMAAIAGIISEYVGNGLLKYSKEVIVENGGDIFIKSHIPRIIGIYAGNSPLSNKIGIEIDPDDTPLGICTSAGKFGHSLSFGNADAVVVLSSDVGLADAAATAAGNMVKKAEDISMAIQFLKRIIGIFGALIIFEDKLAVWGNMNLVKI